MEIKASDFAGAVFILYLLISSNFQAQLFPCRVQRLLNTSQTVKHILGFLTMTFFVVLVNSKNKLGVTKLFAISAGAYLWFMMSAKMNLSIWFMMMFVLGVVFILQVYKDHQEENKPEDVKITIETVTKTQQILSYVVAALTLIGFVIYMGEKRIEYGDEFQLGKFFLGSPTCKGESPNVSFRTALRAVTGRRNA
jgi:hypothetical protein